jgi:hypothetical protein
MTDAPPAPAAEAAAAAFTVTIVSSHVDTQQQFVTFKVVCGTYTTTVTGCLSLVECSNLDESHIVDRAWTAGKVSIADWLAYVQRTDVNIAAMAGQGYVPPEFTS